MAMGSHDDDHYELLIIDTVNNNHNGKLGNNSISQNGKPECSSYVSSDSVETLSGSSRRKYSTLSKGITIEKFLETLDPSNQLTAIDKLILKNKTALAEDQMKRTRIKSKDKPIATQKKNDKNGKTTVLSSKVANNKLGKTNNAGSRNKNSAPRSQNSKTKVTTKVTGDKSKKTAKSVTKVEKAEARPSNSESKSKAETRPNGSDFKSKTDARILNGDSKSKAPKKQNNVPKGCRNNEKAPMNRKTLHHSARKLKREPKINCKSFDMKRLKSNVAYRTRSVNNEKLRNGKTRIIRGLSEEKLPETKKKTSKPKDGTTSANGTPVRDVLKRPIKQEPVEDNGSVKKRKMSVPVVENNNNESVGVQNISNSIDIEKGFPSDLIIKEEPIKEETIMEFDCSNVIENNVNLNISLNNMASREYTLQSSTCRSGSDGNFPKDASVPYELTINNCNGVTGGDIEMLPNEPINGKINQDDDMSENLNLQLDNLDDDIEEIVVNDQTGNSMETESVINEKNENDARVRGKTGSQHTTDDSTRDSIFSALGLQSIDKNGQKSKDKETKDENYRGTLKMVIKTDKGCRRMEMKQAECNSSEHVQNENILSFYSKTIQNGNDRATLNGSPAGSSDSSVMSSLFVEDDTDKDEGKITSSEVSTVKNVDDTVPINNGNVVLKDADKSNSDKSKGDEVSLIVPEKSSSFSIHPNRLCSDVCKYCFGKFGSLDTPCHVGQLKNLERQKKILASEPNLRIDTCLCDACFRYVDRKANRPSNKRKTIRSSSLNQRKVLCAVQNCNQVVNKLFGKRKWRSKICRKFANLSFDIRRRGSGVALGLCFQHFNMLDMYTLCGICKKRLNRNDMYSIRTEVNDLNIILVEDGIPVKLVDNMLLCKYCHHCMSLRLNFGDPSQMEKSNKDYYESFKKEVLRCLRVTNGNSAEVKSSEKQKTENRGIFASEKTSNKLKDPINVGHNLPCTSTPPPAKNDNNSGCKKNHSVDIKDIASLLKPLEGEHSSERNSTHIQLKFGNLNIGKLSNLNIGQNTQSLPAPEKKNERPSESAELPLLADFTFDNDESSRGWERCVSTIQFDKSTKKLWQDLQKPYGNQSSFIRHLIMLEKYWRSGALVLSDSADAGAVKYISSVKNRIESLEVFSTPKLPPVPALAPAPPPPSQKPVIHQPESLPLTPPPLQPAPKHPPPPPLLKLNCLAPFVAVRKSTPICTVRPSPEFNLKTVRTSLPAPPKLERIPTTFVNMPKPIPIPPSKSPIQSQIRPKLQIVQMENVHGQARNVPILKKSPVLTITTGSAMRTIPHFSYAKPPSTMKVNQAAASMIIAKLPKTLSVTQVEDLGLKNKKEIKPPQIATPFLAGEKPSVSVFREIPK